MQKNKQFKQNSRMLTCKVAARSCCALPDCVGFCSSHCACAWEAWGRPCCFSNSSSILHCRLNQNKAQENPPPGRQITKVRKQADSQDYMILREQRNSSVAFVSDLIQAYMRWKYGGVFFLMLAWKESEGPLTYICSTLVRQGECTMLRCQMFATDLKPGHLSCIAWFNVSPSRSYMFVALHLKLGYYIYQLCMYNPIYTDDAL